MRDRLIVATSFLEQKADMLLSDYANVKYHWGLKEVCDDMNVEQEVVFKPWKNEEDPRDAHCAE